MLKPFSGEPVSKEPGKHARKCGFASHVGPFAALRFVIARLLHVDAVEMRRSFWQQHSCTAAGKNQRGGNNKPLSNNASAETGDDGDFS